MIRSLSHLSLRAPWLAPILLVASMECATAQLPMDVSPPMIVHNSIRARADSLIGAGLYDDALSMLGDLLARSPDSYLGHMLSARVRLVQGLGAEPHEATGHLLEALEESRRATELEPAGAEARYVTVAAVGLLGLSESSPRERARFAGIVDGEARALLDVDPVHAGAHNALGRLYLEVASLSWFERIFARHWLGGELVSRATWEAAEEHLRMAIEIQPGRNLYFVDLGALLIKRDRRDEARAVLEIALEVPLEVPEQEKFRDQARRFLAEIGPHPRP